MKTVLILFTMFVGLNGNAAVLGGNDVICNFVAKTVTRISQASQPIVSTQTGRIVLVKNPRNTYGPAEISINEDATAVVSAEIVSNLTVTARVFQTKAHTRQIISSSTGRYWENRAGVYQGGLDLLSPEIETVAVQNGISFDEALTSLKLPVGTSFVALYLPNCF
jgi:hypothetical protein